MPAIWRSVDRFHAAGLVAVAAFGLVSTTALADSGPGELPNFHMLWEASNDTPGPFYYDPADFGTATWGTWVVEGGYGWDPNALSHVRTGWRYEGGLVGEGWELTWDCIANADPFVDATINVTNSSNAVQTFSLYMPLMIAPPIVVPTNNAGFVSAGLSGQTFNPAVMGTNGAEPIFQGYIDTFAQANATLWDPGYTLSTAGPFESASDSDSFSGAMGPPALTEIAVKLEFTLTPGDSVSVTGSFDVQPIPGPAGLALLAVAGVVSIRRRRR